MAALQRRARLPEGRLKHHTHHGAKYRPRYGRAGGPGLAIK
jgi:hypothetical protein